MYVPVYPEDSGDDIRKGRAGDIDILCLGTLPSPGAVLIAAGGTGSRGDEAMYISSLEAALSGFDIITEADEAGAISILSGAEDGGGRLFLSSSHGIRDYILRYPGRVRRLLLTGGGLFSCSAHGECRQGAWAAAAALASSAFIFPGSIEAYRTLVSMLDSGKEAAIPRSSLSSRMARSLVLEGCPACDSLSSALALPSAIVYPDGRGRYAFRSKRYSALLFR